MARVYTPKVNKHVNYVTAAGKLKPATITGIVSGNTINLRITHSGQTLSSIGKQASHAGTNVWRNTQSFT